MTWRLLQALILSWVLALSLEPSKHSGQVKLGGLPVPGAVVTATQNDKRFVTVTDDQGNYAFPDLADGAWKIQVDMMGFSAVQKDVAVSPDGPAGEWELKILPLAEINAATTSARPTTPAPRPAAPRPAAIPAAVGADDGNDLSSSAADGLLINGSVNNGAASPFAQAGAFGNARRMRAVYTGGIGIQIDNSKFDARPYSVTGQNTEKAPYNIAIGGFSLGGPLKIGHVFRQPPNFFFNYQRVQNRNADSRTALMPTAAQRRGDLSAFAGPIVDPSSGLPFAGNQIPAARISAAARALLNLFPSPNSDTVSRYNYQAPLISAQHQDNIQARLGKQINTRNNLNGDFNLQRTANDNPSLFGFLDKSHVWGVNSSIAWNRRIGQRASLTTRYQFSRLTTRVTPYFASAINVSGAAGITGNNQEPLNWGPPNLTFSSGIAALSDAQAASNRNLTHFVSLNGTLNRTKHSLQYGAELRRQQFNVRSQQDARGTFTFTGAASGSDFADFLLGVPTTSSIAFGNADKYFRQSSYAAFLTDDWRVRSGLTLNLGARWEYEGPSHEKYDRLVNLDIARGFTTATPVVGGSLNPDHRGIQPRVSLAWRPLPASSLIVRAGYGIYRNSNVYQSIAAQMAQQGPLSKSLSVQNSLASPLTLTNGFNAGSAATSTTFAVDKDFRVGYAHNWNVSLQRDLPASLMMIATYLGTKGSHLMQQILPNTYPNGAANPCPTCPTNFAYLTSNGSSRRESGQIQLRRRLHNGFTANVQYALSKATDDAGFSAQNPLVAQNWLDLKAEAAPSSFDQRHLVTTQVQYTSGMGKGGGALMSGWQGALFKEWTILSTWNVGSGLPLTPIYLAAVRGTGFSGSIRPDYNGGPPLARSSYSAPAAGKWGNAGRNSVIGPRQFSMNASMARTVRLGDRIAANIRIDATNILNHVAYPAWNMLVTSAQFGLPNQAQPMRKIQSSVRFTF